LIIETLLLLEISLERFVVFVTCWLYVQRRRYQ
jgi:hypothetical protein